MLFNGLLQFLVTACLKLITLISSLVFLPVYTTMTAFIPDFNNYLTTINTFINDYILKGVAFFREVMFNVTGYPRPLFNFLIGFLVFKFGLMITKQVLKMVVHAYYFVRGSK